MTEHVSPVQQKAAAFRQQAIDHYLRRDATATVLRISPPWA
jgi:hypothetical protein